MPPSRDLHQAKEAYQKRNTQASRAAHNAVAKEAHQGAHGKYIKSVVYGGLDGIVTTFAVVAGVNGASLPVGIILIMGFANLLADGLSMAIGDFLSTKAENEYNNAEREREAWEVHHYPEGEKKELIEIYEDKGLTGEDAKAVVEIIARHEDAWVDIMMVEELGIVASEDSPARHALATFASFAFFGFTPLLANVLALFIPVFKDNAFVIASVMTGLMLFVLGALKVLITERNWLRSGLEMLLVGGSTAVAAYLVGFFLQGLAGAS